MESVYCQYIDQLEAVQHSFTRYYRKFHYSYEDYPTRLRRLVMTTLQDRREAADMMFLHKLVHSTVQCNLTDQISFRYQTHGVRNTQLFYLEQCRTNVGQAAPLYRLCSTYNNRFNSCDIFEPFHIFQKNIRSQIEN